MKMKKILYILLLMATCAYAQQENCNALPSYPYYYCECRNTSMPFSFPLSMDIQDTVWFSATVNDLKQGMSAYWFSDCSVTFEVYAFCLSKEPSISMTVGSNQMREMDVAAINKKLDDMGEVASMMSQTLTPRVRVYPNGGSGHVYCYPYNHGPKSTCSDSILPLIARMTYVCDTTSEVYELKPNRIATNGQGFIQWKQKTNQPCTVWLTKDSCAGPEIARATLSDSLRVMMLDPVQMKAIKQAGKSVFVHVDQASGNVGRLVYRNRIVWEENATDTVLCQGKKLQLADTALTVTTVYPNDTLWKKGDTLNLMTYHLTVEPPVPHYDTLLLKAAQLPTTYHNQIIEKDGWGDYEFTIRRANQCDELYKVHVAHDVTRQETIVDTTVCRGRTLSFANVTYTNDTVIQDSVWADADTWVVRDITIHFAEPELEYDTVAVAPEEILDGYLYNALNVLVYSYGDTLIVKTKKNDCTRHVQLTVVEKENTTDMILVPAPSGTYKYMRDGMLYIRREGQDYDLLGRKKK